VPLNHMIQELNASSREWTKFPNHTVDVGFTTVKCIMELGEI
jgi:hypothetical protein